MRSRILQGMLGICMVAAAAMLTPDRLIYAHDHFGNGDDCPACRSHLHGLHHYNDIEGRDPWFNCGCNGSYKFPVPPLYTYHWPGMYSAQRMTDYHSPWRFPPIRAYVDDYQPISARGDVSPSAPRVESTRVRMSPVPR